MGCKIKLCGIQTLEDIEYVNKAKPDYAGFVFAQGRHYITPSIACTLGAKLVGIQSVGVVVDEPLDTLIEIIEISNIDIIQLHGHEDEAYIHALRSRVNIPIWKAIRIQTSADISSFPIEHVEYTLFDSFTKDEAGGSGKRFAWELLEGVDLSKALIAGGIDIGNIKEILKHHPYGVDISSGVEVLGKKDKDKMKEIVNEVRAYA